jgi:hypothetical protein
MRLAESYVMLKEFGDRARALLLDVELAPLTNGSRVRALSGKT